MTTSKRPRPLRRAAALVTVAALSLPVGAVAAAGAEPPILVVEDFESLPAGTDADGVAIGFSTFQGAGSTVAVDTAVPPETADGVDGQALRMDVDVTSYAGVVSAFANEEVTEWVPQDWSTYKGFTMWLYGLGTGNTLFVDLLENRNPGSTTDDAERWSVDVVDDFTGWRELSIPFSALTRKGVGNNAPDDGFEGTEMHGWALGALGTGGARTYWVDNVGVYGVAEVPDLAVGFAARNVDVPEGGTGDVTVRLNRTMREGDPEQVSVGYTVEPGTAESGRDYTPVTGTLTFTQGGPRELTFPLATFDNAKDDGDRRVIMRLSDPVGAAPGIMQSAGMIVDDEPYDPLLVDDFERAPDLWDAGDAVALDNPEIGADDADAVPGQGAWEHVLAATVGGPVGVDVVVEGGACTEGNGVVPVTLLSTPTFDATSVDHTTVSLGGARETHVDGRTGLPRRHEADADGDGLTDLVFHVRPGDAGLECGDVTVPLSGETFDGRTVTTEPTQERFGRDFALGEDWSGAESLSFWYRGHGTGDEVTVEVLDNRAPDPGPDGWDLVWSDEFDEPAGTPPNPDNWGYELGDGTVNGIPGWGNSELQYYTDDPENAATDGEGNLVITAREADGEQCYYGECEYTSARLLSAHKAEFAYGRIESRIQVPDGGPGLWPAFWSLGTDIEQVGWPQTGEIDFMEYVSRIPDEVFGTVHGPGYSGGAAYGDIVDVDGGVPGEFHTTTVEWGPDRIEWYLDGTLYHTATPADVAPDEWVFNDPVFLLLNMAVGGSFGGAVDPGTTFPQEMKVDYVRVFQGPDTAERFEASFVDDVAGWRQVTVPFSELARSAEQPAGAPDDGLGLDEVWGYGFRVPSGSGTVLLDQVRLGDTTPPEVTVTDDVPAETATGEVTFTFAFSEDVGTSFTASDVALTGGTKGAFTSDGTHATLVARPPADSAGTLEVAVAAGAFTDLAGNANTAGVSARQAFDTPPAPSGGFVISFDEDPAPALTGFGGAVGTVVPDPADPSNRVAEIVKGAPAELWAGVTVSTGPGLSVPAVPFGAATTMTARVWSPAAGVPVRLKVENAADGAVSVETEATTTTAGAWETLTFDLADHVPGTAALDPAATYDKVSVFPGFGTAHTAADTPATFYLDDLGYPVAGGPVISFDPAPTLLGFGGAEDSTVVPDPADPANQVLRVVKNGPEVWAGTIVATEDDLRVPVIPFTASATTMTARVWSPEVGIPVRLKVEAADPAVNVETEATTTVAGAWETLSFDFANPVAAALDPAAEYTRLVVFFDFGTVGTGATYYADDITFP